MPATVGSCFVLMPFRETFNSYYQQIIIPAIQATNLHPVRADEITQAGTIVNQVWDEIHAATLCIAELTGLNANVMYELGLADALQKPTILLTQNVDEVPFDLRHRRLLAYDTRQVDWSAALRQRLIQMITATLSNLASSLPFASAAPLQQESRSSESGSTEHPRFLRTEYADIDHDRDLEVLLHSYVGAHSSEVRIFDWDRSVIEVRLLAELRSNTPNGFWAEDIDNDGKLELISIEDYHPPGSNYSYAAAPRVKRVRRWDGTRFVDLGMVFYTEGSPPR